MAVLRRKLTMAKNQGYRVIYADETMITRKTIPELEWSKPKENHTVDAAKLQEPTLAILAGISKEKGMEHFKIFERSVNGDKFEIWLDELKAITKEEKVLLFLDNLKVHTCERGTDAMKKRGFRWAFNLPYSPE